MTLSGIEPASFRLVVQCVNQMRHRVHRFYLPGLLEYDAMRRERDNCLFNDALKCYYYVTSILFECNVSMDIGGMMLTEES
jgi:hypothetical protein